MKDNYEYLINVISNNNPNINIVEKDNKLVLIYDKEFNLYRIGFENKRDNNYMIYDFNGRTGFKYKRVAYKHFYENRVA